MRTSNFELRISPNAIVSLSIADRNRCRLNRAADSDSPHQPDAPSQGAVGGDGIFAREPEAESHLGHAEAAVAVADANGGDRGRAFDGRPADYEKRAIRRQPAAPYRAVGR
jgi:hypothetical protein